MGMSTSSGVLFSGVFFLKNMGVESLSKLVSGSLPIIGEKVDRSLVENPYIWVQGWNPIYCFLASQESV
jgi:hypothetical protein